MQQLPFYKSILLSIFASAGLLFSSFHNDTDDHYRVEFDKAYELLIVDNFTEALNVLKALKLEGYNNPNLDAMIGYCFLRSDNQAQQAIDMFRGIQFPEDLNPDYVDGNALETMAPVEAVLHLGQAYHLNYEFDKAMEMYLLYESYIKDHKSAEHKLAEKRITEVDNAIQLFGKAHQAEVMPMQLTNTTAGEYRPLPNDTGERLYFTARRVNEAKDSNRQGEDGQYFEDIYRAVFERGQWTYLEPVSELNTEGHEAILYVNEKEDKVLMYQFNEEQKNGGDIMASELIDGKWKTPEKMGKDINSRAWETHSTITATTDIVFTSDRKGTEGKRDIWMYSAESGEIMNMGATINTKYDEDGAYLTEDGKTLYFSSKGHNSVGGFDIFKSERMEDGSWSEPVNLGFPINSPGDDIFYIPPYKGRDGYFSSFRKGGVGNQDLYIVPNRERTNIYSGTATDENGTPIEGALIAIYEVESNKVSFELETGSDGAFLFAAPAQSSYRILTLPRKEKEPTEGLSVQESNVRIVETATLSDEKILSLANGKKYTKLTDVTLQLDNALAETHRAELEKLKADALVNEAHKSANETRISNGEFITSNELKSLYFKYDAVDLMPKSQEDLTKILTYLINNPTTKIELTGHTDSKGTAAYNKELSKRRAVAIKNYLLNLGIEEVRITTIGLGKEQPAAQNITPDGQDNPEGRQLNRRVEFKLIQ